MFDLNITREPHCPFRQTLVSGALMLGLLSSGSVAALAPQEILAKSDSIRNPGRPFTIAVDIVEYKNGQSGDITSLAVYSKIDKSNGQYRSLIRYVAPARDAGKLMLKNGNDLWFYDPNNKANIRISPQQRLLGQAANGDVVTVNLALDYKVTLDGEEEIMDGEQKKRPCEKLSLQAASADVTYDHIEMWVDKMTHGPVKGKFYSESNALLKTVYYRKYKSELGAERPTEMVIIDGLNPKLVTLMRYRNYQYKEIPDAQYQRDYLPRFTE